MKPLPNSRTCGLTVAKANSALTKKMAYAKRSKLRSIEVLDGCTLRSFLKPPER